MRTKNGLKGLLAAAAFVFAGQTAHATEVLTYTGNPFTASSTYTPQGVTSNPGLIPSLGTSVDLTLVLSVAEGYTGTLTYNFAGPSPWTSFSATAVGGFSINGAVNDHGFWTTASVSGSMTLVDGLPTSWDINAFDGGSGYFISTINSYIPIDNTTLVFDTAQIGGNSQNNFTNPGNSNNNSPGVWSMASGVPEPGSWALMLVGVTGLGMALRFSRDHLVVAAEGSRQGRMF